MGDDKPTIEFVTPQFGREDGVEPEGPPDDFSALHEMTEDELEEQGLRKWSEGLYLFPYQWYDDIPNGFEVTTINGEQKPFDPKQDLDERRFGVLPYGIKTE